MCGISAVVRRSLNARPVDHSFKGQDPTECAFLFGRKTEWLRHFVESSAAAHGLILRVMPSDAVNAADPMLADLV